MALNADVLALGEAFWTWRAATQPLSGDDIPRIERPAGWAPDWSPDAIAERRKALARFDREHAALSKAIASASVQDQVDWRLLGSAIARVHWELDVPRGWQRNPQFYVHQTLGAIFEALLTPPPFGRDLLARLESIPRTLEAARENLAADAVRPFAELALSSLGDIVPRLSSVEREVAPHLKTPAGQEFANAGRALERFAEWLRGHLDSMSNETAIGRQAYVE